MGRFGNVEKMIDISLHSWRQATSHKLTHIRTHKKNGNKLTTTDGHTFINMVSCSYLGLNSHPGIIAGALRALSQEQTMSTSVSRARIAPALLDEVEEKMSRLFRAEAVITISCSAASAGVLPILGSGHFTDRKKPVMVFDKNCHFSMNMMKAACADETDILTCEHNDVQFVEDACRRHSCVAYVADGAYSMGGNAPIGDLKVLQEKYGLFLYIDDSHSISVHGDNGVGLTRAQFGELPERTIIVGSLAKAFGATGGVILLGRGISRELIDFCAGPLGWSQMINAPGLGAIDASADIHMSSELPLLQARLQRIMSLIDETIPTANSGNGLPIRVFDLCDVDKAVEVSQQLFERGFYCSAVFFPIVARGRAGIRVMGRADMSEEDIFAFCNAVQPLTSVGS